EAPLNPLAQDIPHALTQAIANAPIERFAADEDHRRRSEDAADPRQSCSPTRGRPPGEMADAARRAMQAGAAGSAVARSSPRGPRRTQAATGWHAAATACSRQP